MQMFILLHDGELNHMQARSQGGSWGSIKPFFHAHSSSLHCRTQMRVNRNRKLTVCINQLCVREQDVQTLYSTASNVAGSLEFTLTEFFRITRLKVEKCWKTRAYKWNCTNKSVLSSWPLACKSTYEVTVRRCIYLGVVIQGSTLKLWLLLQATHGSI